MPIELYVFLTAYLLIYSLLFLVGYCLFSFKNKQYFRATPEQEAINEFALIIPFRNEEKRIQKLLNSILNSDDLPAEIVFVDDHSTDSTVKVIAETLQAIPHTILSLPPEKTGKKQGIRCGIEASTSHYILTIDADTYFRPTYFRAIKTLPARDLIILPVVLRAEKFMHHLFEIDLILLNGLNIAATGWWRPILASGANLLVKRKAFEQFDRFEMHQHIASGDDMYLLRDFRHANASIQVITAYPYAVFTETPQSIRAFFSQRLRWFAKSGDVNDQFSSVLGGIQLASFFLFCLLMGWFSYQLDFMSCLLLYLAKTAIDLAFFYPVARNYHQLVGWLLLPIYEVIAPIYMIILFLLTFTKRPTWKDRKIMSR
jgi:biofilm PGA synthesis N-glycosyltransferase PgaC